MPKAWRFELSDFEEYNATAYAWHSVKRGSEFMPAQTKKMSRKGRVMRHRRLRILLLVFVICLIVFPNQSGAQFQCGDDVKAIDAVWLSLCTVEVEDNCDNWYVCTIPRSVLVVEECWYVERDITQDGCCEVSPWCGRHNLTYWNHYCCL